MGINVANIKSASIVYFQDNRNNSIPKHILHVAVVYEGGLILYKFINEFKYELQQEIIMKIPGATTYSSNFESIPWVDKIIDVTNL